MPAHIAMSVHFDMFSTTTNNTKILTPWKRVISSWGFHNNVNVWQVHVCRRRRKTTNLQMRGVLVSWSVLCYVLRIELENYWKNWRHDHVNLGARYLSGEVFRWETFIWCCHWKAVQVIRISASRRKVIITDKESCNDCYCEGVFVLVCR